MSSGIMKFKEPDFYYRKYYVNILINISVSLINISSM